MAHANAIFLSLVSGAALVLGLAPGCSNNTTQPAQAAIIWTVSPGTNSAAVCGSGGNDTWTIGNPEGHPIVTASNGTNFNNVPVSLSCTVSPNSTGFSVTAVAQYGSYGSLSLHGQITVTPGASQPGPQTGITGTFVSGNGLIASLSESNCTITFSQNQSMGIAPTRIWGVIDCPQATTTNGDTTCDGNAEFLFEDCGQ
jgi:hypothetical protein